MYTRFRRLDIYKTTYLCISYVYVYICINMFHIYIYTDIYKIPRPGRLRAYEGCVLCV